MSHLNRRGGDRRATALLLVGLSLASLTVLGCSDDGKDLRAPPPGATAPLRPTSTTVAGTESTAGLTPGLLSLTSPDFQPGQPLADDATCLGVGRSPALAWTGLPEGTAEIAVVMSDPDDDLFTNWIVAGIDPTSAAPAGRAPEGAVEARNGDGQSGYAPPCPPSGDTHLIEFTLYALSAPSGVTAEMTADEAIAVLDAAPGTRAVVTATVTNG